MFNLIVGRMLWRWLSQLESAAKTNEDTANPDSGPSTHSDLTTHDSRLTTPEPPPSWHYPRVQRPAMGCLYEIYLAGTDRETLVGAAEEALNDVERLDRQLSHYKDDSDVARLNAHAATHWVRLEPRMYALLKRCAEIHSQTGGAFDITLGPLIKAWGFYRGEGRIPSDKEIEEVMQRIGMDRVLFDDSDDLVHFTAPGMEINLGAIGKGYAIDQAAETLRTFNVNRAVLHGGQSSIYALGAPPDREGWEFSIKDPRDRETVLETVLLRNEAISTSGSYEQFFEVDGARYSHILDPRTGRPTTGMLSVSVIAESATDTDALSTAFFVMGREATEEFCRTHPDLRVIIVEESNDDILVTRIGFDDPAN